MQAITEFPVAVLAFSFAVMSLAVWIGSSALRRHRTLEEDVHESYGLIVGGTLTVLGLIIGFTFSMAVSRYDQRKNLEEAEANAIGTEYLRADLLPADDAAKVRGLLKSYLDQRLLYYSTRDAAQLRRVDALTARLQDELWAVIRSAAAAQPTPTVALVVAGMNDVLNAQGYTQAAWWNRIPTAAWMLMVSMAVVGSLLIGYGCRDVTAGRWLLWVLPAVVSLAFFLIADIDSPRHGVIRVSAQNLAAVAEALRGPRAPQ
jgi:hypothetical protein